MTIEQMLDHARAAREVAAGIPFDKLRADRLRWLALMRALEIVGEAARRLPIEIRQQRPVIPWRDVVGLRNRLIHGYDNIDPAVIARVVNIELPPLIALLEAWLDELDR